MVIYKLRAGQRFQSTLPSREETSSLLSVLIGLQISIHSSLAGRDCLPGFSVSVFNDFNPLFPRGKRLKLYLSFEEYGKISIHSSLAGRDIILRRLFLRLRQFQSTLPSREETYNYFLVANLG